MQTASFTQQAACARTQCQRRNSMADTFYGRKYIRGKRKGLFQNIIVKKRKKKGSDEF